MAIVIAINYQPSTLICKPWSDRLLNKSATMVMAAVTSTFIDLRVWLPIDHAIVPSSHVTVPCAQVIAPTSAHVP